MNFYFRIDFSKNQVMFKIEHLNGKFSRSWPQKSYYEALCTTLYHYLRDLRLFPCLLIRLNHIEQSNGSLELGSTDDESFANWKRINAHALSKVPSKTTTTKLAKWTNPGTTFRYIQDSAITKLNIM